MNIATKFILLNLRITGLDPFYQNKTAKCLSILSASVCVLIFWPYLIDFIFHFDGIKSIDNFLMAPVPLQFLGIICIFNLKRQIICDLLNASKLMWPIHKFGPVLEKRISALRRRAIIIGVTIYSGFIFLSIIIFTLYFVYDKWLFLEYKQCGPPLCNKLQFLLQFLLTFPIAISTAHTFFILFWNLILECLCHLDMLKYGIQNILSGKIEENLKDIVDQHVNILRFIKLISSTYSSSLLFAFIMYPIYIIIGLFLITQEGMPSSMMTTIKYFTAIFVASMNLFVFCAAGEVIQIKLQSVCNTIYEIDWLHTEAKPNRLGKDVVVLLQMTQTNPDINVSSLFPLNLNVYLQVLKFCYSVYTFLEAIRY